MMDPASQLKLLQNALAHHQANRLDEAEALYRKLLLQHSDNVDALHLLGIACAARGGSRSRVGTGMEPVGGGDLAGGALSRSGGAGAAGGGIVAGQSTRDDHPRQYAADRRAIGRNRSGIPPDAGAGSEFVRRIQ